MIDKEARHPYGTCESESGAHHPFTEYSKRGLALPPSDEYPVQCNVCGFCCVEHVGALCQSPRKANALSCFGRMFIKPLLIDADWRCRPDTEEQERFVERCVAEAMRSAVFIHNMPPYETTEGR